MPEADYDWLPKAEILTYEEMTTLAAAFAKVGVTKLRLTGGEPLLRRDLSTLVAMLSGLGCFEDIALTTNGVLLAEQIDDLLAAGLGRITISLDTLRADRYERMTGSDRLSAALDGIESAVATGAGGLKINMVVVGGMNDDELADMVRFGQRIGAEVRFIEYMDVGGATRWSDDAVVPKKRMLASLATDFGTIAEVSSDPHAPADRFALPDGTTFGVISSTTAPFCGNCDRSRITADGHWYTCLYARSGMDLKTMLRDGVSADELTATIRDRWSRRIDRGAEERLTLGQRGTFVPVSELRLDPRLEMHTRGG